MSTTEKIEITLDGKKLLAERGATILSVAEGQGVKIPTLCHDPRLEPYASCWVCLVKVERAKGFVPACGTKVQPGMVISTSSADVLAARRMALDLLLSNHYGDCKAPCTLTCPSNVDIQGYLGLAANGKLAEAVALIRRDNPMPAVIGRICPRPCEGECRRQHVDEPLNINGIKRFVADVEARAGGMPPRPAPPRLGKKVAVVGGGPAGLSAAWYLSEMGVDVTVYEAMEKAGGMLRYGIPDYRLPPAVLDQAIKELLSLGAELKTAVRLGVDVSVEDLRAQYDAVVLAVGAWRSRALRIPGENHKEVLSGIDFLRDVNSGKPVTVGARVAIIGGGNTAMDAARCSLRLGAKEVAMYYRRSREEMPASDAEIEEAIEEGVRIQYLAAPLSIETDGDALKSLTLLKMELGEPDASGRRKPVPVEGSEFSVPVDTVISAVGQYADTRPLAATAGLVDERENLKGDHATGRTAVPGVFAAGDLLTGTDIAIRAVAGGKHAARAVLAYFEGRTYERPREFLSKKTDFKAPTPEDFKDTPRVPRGTPVVMAAEQRKKSFVEIEASFSRDQALAEAARCMECGCQDVKECKLKEYATGYDAVAKRFLGEVARHPVDNSHPFISRDPSKCVLCGRCIRICLEVQGAGVFGYMYRGFTSVVAPSFGVPFGEDKTCVSCGQCVSACPVGALTEKLPAGKSTPLDETVEEGYCSLCSVGCGLEYRWHGSLLTRVTERFVEPNNGKLCKKGKFGHDFLNQAVPAQPVAADGSATTLAGARDTAMKLLASARQPRMRISPYLCGEAIDTFLEAAARNGIPVEGMGTQGLDPRWVKLLNGGAGASGGVAAGGAGTAAGAAATPARATCILVGDIAASNNVALTEAWRMKRQGTFTDLWIVGHDDGAARRVATRVFPEIRSLREALREAAAAGALRVLVNPEEVSRAFGRGETKILEALLDAVKGGKTVVTLLWNARNTGYLFSRLANGDARPRAGRSAGRSADTDTAAPQWDLTLDVGVEDAGAEGNRIVWGRKPGGKALFVPLSAAFWTKGRSYPSGRGSVQAGSVDEESLRSLALLL